jgi:hypothetical protein
MLDLTFKIATEDLEFEQIHRLNYRTFVEEIPQHPSNPEGRLVDHFHHENTYLIGLQGDKLQGMIAVRDRRPFSLDYKLPNLDAYLPSYRSICEFRLLAVERNRRHSLIFQGIVSMLAQYCDEHGYDLAVMSGTVRQLQLYRHLGFVPFGPLVGTSEAKFQPLYLTRDAYELLKGKVKLFSR